MGNVFKLIQNWLSSQPDDNAKNITPFHRSSFISTDQPAYSWDNKSEIEANQFRLNHLKEQHIFQSLVYQGQQFTIEDCLRSLIVITGFSDSIFVDDCKDCKIILGPVKGSIFLRNCSHCVVVAACGQLRTRDCTEVTCYLLCASQPSIETSSLMKFQCISLDYPGLQGHLTNAGLDSSLTVNRWSEVFDFTPTSLSSNWKFLAVEDRLEDNLNEVELIHCTDHQIAFDRTVSAIPFTHPALKTSVYDNSLATIGWDISENFYDLLDSNLKQSTNCS